MKLKILSILLCGILTCMATSSLTAATATATATDAPATIKSESFESHGDGVAPVKMEGVNLTINSVMSSNQELRVFWSDLPDFKAYRFTGKGVMQPGYLYIDAKDASSQFTIESDIKLIHTYLVVNCGKLIFKGEFSSSPYYNLAAKSNTPSIAIFEGGSLDLNEATLNPENNVQIELSGGNLISDKLNITEKHMLSFSKSSNITGDLNLATGAKLSISMDVPEEVRILNVSGDLNLASNVSINFKQKVNNDPIYGNAKIELKSGTVIAHARSINGDFKGITVMETVTTEDSNSGTESTKTALVKGMKVVSLKNGNGYDLVITKSDEK